MPNVPNPAVPKEIPKAVPPMPNSNSIPTQPVVNPNPVPNPSGVPQVPPTNPAMPVNPVHPIPSQNNPNGLPTSLLNNPALPKSNANPKYPPLRNPSPPKSPSISGFPNTNGNVVLGRSSNLPDVGEQKIFLPSQLANQQNLVRDQKTPSKETKQLLPSQISSMQNFGNGQR
jgi:hypothetical protein